MWYSKNYRRHLADMHIADWDESFLSEFSYETYVENLKTAKVTNAMIYLQSHTGLCNFPTKSGVMHKAFVGKENTMRKFFDLCHENKIAVTGYYSLNYNTLEHDRHPDWRMIDEDGYSIRTSPNTDKSEQKLDFASKKMARYGLCCPNNKDHRAFVYEQIGEMIALYPDMEGIFYDMPFWHHTCYCENCKKRFLKEKGYELPRNPKPDTKEYADLLEVKYRWMGEWIQSVTDHTKALAPNMSVEHNFAAGISTDSNSGSGEEVARACDFVGGDLYGGIINHSLACKFYQNITPNAPFDYMFSRCKPGLRTHTLTKTLDEMKTEIMLNASHHGATMVIDAIDPVGTLDERVYHRIGQVFGFQEQYEKYFTGTMVEDVGLYYSIKSRYNTQGEEYDNKTSAIGVTKTLIGAHLPFGVTGNFHTLDGYKVLILPMLTDFEKNDFDRIEEYVRNGGCVYISGATSEQLLYRLLGAKFEGYTEENNVYIAPTNEGLPYFMGFNSKYPLPFTGVAPIVKNDADAQVLATLTLPYTSPSTAQFASIHSDPPGISTEHPIVLRRRLGKGSVVWSALPIETIDIYEYKEIFKNLFLSLCPDYKPSFCGAIPDDVEITLYDAGDNYTLNVCSVAEVPIARNYSPFEVKVKTDKKPKLVKLLPIGEEIPFAYEDGYCVFNTRKLNVFDMYMIEK